MDRLSNKEELRKKIDSAEKDNFEFTDEVRTKMDVLKFGKGTH